MTIETFTTDVLETGSDKAQTTATSFGSGLSIAANTPVAQDSTDGLFYPWDPAGLNGRDVALRLTAVAVDTTGGARDYQAYKSGTFNPELIQWPTSTALEQSLQFAGTPISIQAPQ